MPPKKKSSSHKEHFNRSQYDEMSMSELRKLARSLGIPFGILTKSQLLKKIKDNR